MTNRNSKNASKFSCRQHHFVLYIPSVKKQKHKNYVYIKKQIEKLKKNTVFGTYNNLRITFYNFHNVTYNNL